MVQVWTEILRNAELEASARAGYDSVRAAWARVVESYKSVGLIAPEANADALARVMIALAQGYAAQPAVIGELPKETLDDGLRALMSMRDARPAG
ncbi:hypothetical protein [Streptomyces sp. NPDC002758]